MQSAFKTHKSVTKIKGSVESPKKDQKKQSNQFKANSYKKPDDSTVFKFFVNLFFYLNSFYKLRSHYQERLWLKKHGKQKYIQFDDDELLELRKYFSALDADGGGINKIKFTVYLLFFLKK